MLEVLILRHGIAEDPSDAQHEGRDEFHRELTEEGIARTAEVCAGLATELDGLDRILSSPLVRARQTAAILLRSFPDATLDEWSALAPAGEGPAVIAAELDDAQGRVALVGHEPDLGLLASWLLTGEDGGFIEVKKAGAILIATEGPSRGLGELIWSLPPRVSRQLATRA